MKFNKKPKDNKIYKVQVNENNVVREVRDINEAQAVIKAAKELDALGNTIIETRILSEEKNLLEHRKIKHIIHSGEYTVSMLYDVTKIALDMAVDFINYGVYSFDLLPHNFTLENGKWILYDFGALQTDSRQAKTQIRSTFKITFAAFELLKVIKREKLKHYFLNRIKAYELTSMIPFWNWIKYMFRLRSTQLFGAMGLYKQAYKSLRNIFIQYEKDYIPKIYEYKISNEEIALFDIIDEIVREMNVKDVFCTGELSGKWAVNSDKNLTKFVYIDEYDLCDKYYNYVKTSGITNISTAVLYPLMQDSEISQNLSYRALYDYFAQDRFFADTAIILNFDEISACKDFDLEQFCSAIFEFTDKHIIIKTGIPTNLTNVLSKIYKEVNVIQKNQFSLIVGKNKIVTEQIVYKQEYANSNRMAFAKEHSKKILKILGK